MPSARGQWKRPTQKRHGEVAEAQGQRKQPITLPRRKIGSPFYKRIKKQIGINFSVAIPDFRQLICSVCRVLREANFPNFSKARKSIDKGQDMRYKKQWLPPGRVGEVPRWLPCQLTSLPQTRVLPTMLSDSLENWNCPGYLLRGVGAWENMVCAPHTLGGRRENMDLCRPI